MKKVFTMFLGLGIMASVALAAPSQINVSVKGMMCSSCAKKMQKKFKAQPGVDKVSIDVDKGLVAVTLKEGKTLSDEQIKSLVDGPEFSVATIRRM